MFVFLRERESVRRGVYHLFYSTTFRRFTAISLSSNCARLLIMNTRALTRAISDENIKMKSNI